MIEINKIPFLWYLLDKVSDNGINKLRSTIQFSYPITKKIDFIDQLIYYI